MQNFVEMPIFKANNGKYYVMGPGEKFYIKVPLSTRFRRYTVGYLISDTSKIVKFRWSAKNPYAGDGIVRSEAVDSKYGYLLEPIQPSLSE